MNHTLSDSQLEAMIKSAVNSSGALPPDEKFSQLVSALRELHERRKAERDSEPVAWRRFQETPTDGGYWILYDYKPNCSGVEPLYRHAQPAPVAPVCTCPSGAGSLRWPCPVHPGNSPVTGIDLASGPDRTVEVRYVAPPGYVMVPKEPTEAMMLHNSGCQHHAWDDPDCAMRQTRRLIWSHMLAAAPQETNS
ncbi:hypothetical protein FMJ40_27095 [Klebsiella variicola]|uniref:hypothetical protein n=1 Tax=Klebsiella variicola TaxID=244366 RepID=UPI001CC9D831|nr:hypothetical protein [Klebsiella variicola]MBZ6550919.1 hypothetical protein [Klebsiella variicola]MBZ6574327.1 hypothetical protein [Klebsiella variicola]MBZ7582069.1 hypothetical protein [Klebsiella variicola]